MAAAERKVCTALSASMLSMPRMSSSEDAALRKTVLPPLRAGGAFFFCPCRSASSTRRTSSGFTVILRMPAFRLRLPSLLTAVTSAHWRTPGISTWSPARMGRLGLGMGSRLSCRTPTAASASLRRRRRSAFSPLSSMAVRAAAWRRRISSSSAKMALVCCRASFRMRRASASPRLRAFSLAFSICSRNSLAFRASSSRRTARRSSSCSFFSSAWRLLSSWVMTSSKRTLSPFICRLASAMTSSLRPSRWEMAKALDFPGMPMSSRYVGRRVSTSNSQEAFSTPAVVMAKVFSSA